ncbi:hypothetical protein [Parapedobacter lycopersici]|uniref:hypothetical protein n=1 Tax=Parapedobacter lycopersici TaxID=1864939 RepID=UPI00214DEFA4|nr:hypothetical protein [Parapedobacter lycopersici]
MSTTLKRIKEYIDFKGIRISTFEKSIGISNGSFGGQLKKNKTIGVDKLESILRLYPDLSAEWVLTGNGTMLKDTESYEQTIESLRKVIRAQEKTIAVLERFIPVKQ